MFGLKEKEKEAINAAAPAPVIPAAKTPTFVKARAQVEVEADLGEYATIAKEVGIEVPQIIVERFMGAMEKLNYPIYNRAEVVAYMDEKAKTDGTGHGWEWRPVRDKDHIGGAYFGEPCRRLLMSDGVTPASDFYCGPERSDSLARFAMLGGSVSSPRRYGHVIPLHALQRIAGIEKAYSGPTAFFVSDYATQPHVRPDPFLMVVLRDVPLNLGRFVIDFWDEPGFGIASMLK